MVEDGRTGYLVRPRNVTQLAEYINRLLLDPELRHRMGANGRRKIEAECSPEVIARATMEIYARVIAQGVQDRKSNWLRRPAPAPVPSIDCADRNN